MDALLDEPLVGELVGLADTAEDGPGRDPHVLEDELRVPVGEGVHVVRIVLDPDAGHVVVDEEERREVAIAVDDVGVEDHEVGVVGAGDEPLLAVEHVLAGRRIADGGRADRPRIGASAVLGDGVAARALAAHGRVEVAASLVRVRVDQHVVRPRDVRPEATRRLAELLVDEDLVEHGPALAAELHGEVAAVEARLDGRAPDRITPVPRDLPVRALELELLRLQHVLDEPAGARLQLELGRGQGEVHVVSLAYATTRSPAPSRAAGRPQPGWARTMMRISVMSSIAQRRPSRPSPESLTPP